MLVSVSAVFSFSGLEASVGYSKSPQSTVGNWCLNAVRWFCRFSSSDRSLGSKSQHQMCDRVIEKTIEQSQCSKKVHEKFLRQCGRGAKYNVVDPAIGIPIRCSSLVVAVDTAAASLAPCCGIQHLRNGVNECDRKHENWTAAEEGGKGVLSRNAEHSIAPLVLDRASPFLITFLKGQHGLRTLHGLAS